MEPSEAAVSVSGLTKYYGELLAVDHVSFEGARGEIFGVLGPNGAGKTTTIRMLTNLATPSEGEATILGYKVERSALRLREMMGVIPENPNVFDELSSLDNLLFTGELYGMSRGKLRERAEELLARFGLEDKAKAKARELSKGLKRRLSITMGLIHDPEILFLDEPTSGLDVHSAVTIRETLQDLHRDGKTMFYTTHNMSEAGELCERIAVLDGGRVITIGSPERLKQAANRSQSVEVAFEKRIPQADTSELSALEGVERVRAVGDKFRLSTSNPPVVLESVYRYAVEKNTRIMSINTMGDQRHSLLNSRMLDAGHMGPSLEDVFLEITESTE